MAPKKKARAVLKTTRKVVEETVQVEVIDNGEKVAEIAMKEGMEIGKEARDEVTRTTVIIGGDGETEEIAEGQEKRVEILIESQNLKEPAPATPRKEEEKKGAGDREMRETEKERSPEVRSERETEQAEVVEERREAGADTGAGGKGVMEVETRDEVAKPEAERRDETGKETEEPETEKEDETGEPEAEKSDETGEDTEKGAENHEGDAYGEGLVKTLEKQEVGRTGERDEGVRGGETKNRKRRRRRRRGEGIGGGEQEQYKRYVYRVLKQVHPELGISSAAMEVLNAYMNDMFERLADEAARLSRYTERKTLSSREVQSAVRLVLPGELGRHAIAEGAKAVTNYMSYGDD